MSLLNKRSLIATLHAVDEAVLRGNAITSSDAAAVALWTAGRIDADAGEFRPVGDEMDDGLTLFTGERVRSGGSWGILSMEATRCLRRLGVRHRLADEATAAANRKRLASLAHWRKVCAVSKRDVDGLYCCATCTPALWRLLALDGLPGVDAAGMIERGMAALRKRRNRDGTWRQFRFGYTLLALCDIGLPAAAGELRHAARACERLLRKPAGDGLFDGHRRLVARRALALCC